MWPSKYSWNWNSQDVGPGRNILGELSEAFAQQAPNVKFGLYYSLYEWFHPLYLQDKANNFKSNEYVMTVMLPQLREIINSFKPQVVWADGEWEAADWYWNSTDFLAWLYNDSPVKDTVVTNDRWGNNTECKHGGFLTCSDHYNPGVLQSRKFENGVTLDRESWGFRRNAALDDYRTIEELIYELVSTVSCGGNMIMNIGPTHDGRIVPVMEERLDQMGKWLKLNGEGVYKTKPWIFQNDTTNPNVWFTSKLRSYKKVETNRIWNPQDQKNTIVYAHLLQWPQDDKFVLASPTATSQTTISLLGYAGTLPFKATQDKGLEIDLSGVRWHKLPNTWAWTFKIEYLGPDPTRQHYLESVYGLIN